jgi:hypothetical protein
MKNSVFSELLYFQFIFILEHLKNSDILEVNSQNFNVYRSRIFRLRPDLEWSLNSRIMIKANQHMFPNKFLVKIANLSENPNYKSLKIFI